MSPRADLRVQYAIHYGGGNVLHPTSTSFSLSGFEPHYFTVSTCVLLLPRTQDGLVSRPNISQKAMPVCFVKRRHDKQGQPLNIR